MTLPNRISTKSQLPPAVIVTIIVVVVVLLGFFGWKTIGGIANSERVPVDVNTVKESIKENGFGHN